MIPFAKGHGLGNDYIVMDEADLPRPLSTEAIVKICVQGALTGKACPGSLKVNVPWDYHPAGAQ